MTSPQQFVESFLKDKAAVYAEANARLAPLFKESFGAPLSERAGAFLMRDVSRVVFDDIKESAGSARLITRDPDLKGPVAHTRYHLSATDESWRIIRVDHQCFICQGTGRSGQEACPTCNGEGWFDTPKNKG